MTARSTSAAHRNARRAGAIALAWALIAAAATVDAQDARMKVVLDTDIGTDIDDGWALGYALKSPSFDQIGRASCRERVL